MHNLVSILITTFQRPALLNWGLYSLARQAVPFPFETIVLNDGIPDYTERVCRRYQSKLHLSYNFTGQRNLDGSLKWRVPGFAFNIGARQATGDILLLCCAEIFHLNDTVVSLVTPLLENEKWLAIPVGWDDQDGSFLEYLTNHGGSFAADRLAGYPELCTLLPFAMAVSKREFFAIGGYDEDFTGIAYDDCDLVSRLQQNGCQYRKTAAQVIHLYHPRLADESFENPAWIYNKSLYYQRLKELVRNRGREWGRAGSAVSLN